MKAIPSALAAPWAIEPHWLRVVYGVWSRGQLDAAALSQARSEWEARKASRPMLSEPGAPVDGTGDTLRIIGDVGVLSIEGPLFRHASLFCDFSGGTSYDAIRRGLEAALGSRAVSTILLRINSPGGEADGVGELAREIAAADAIKPVYAYVDGICASAAFWLGSQARHISAEESSEIGSIGVRCGIVDYSAADEMAGVREIEIISSQSPGKRSKPVDASVVSRLQTRIDDLADLFIAAVASGRGVTTSVVLEDFGQGDVMIASKAVRAGLIDEVSNFNGTLAAIAGASSGERAARAGDHMTKPNASGKPVAGDDASGGGEWQCNGCNEMMGPSAKAFCAKCSDDDENEDEDEAKALGLDPKATASARRARMAQLVALEQRVLSATGAENHDAAMGRIASAAAAAQRLPELEAQVTAAKGDELRRELRATLERGLAGSPGKQPTLSLGAIQRTMPVALRGDSKKAWLAAMDKLATDAEAGKTTVSAAQVIDAACSVSVSAEDLEAVREFTSTSAPVAAANYIEPHRNGENESVEAEAATAEVTRLAAKARKVLDRNNKPAPTK